MQFTIYQDSRRGGRQTNQDRVAYSYSRDCLLMIVADGMGGHAGGEIAAQMCVRLLIERFQAEARPNIDQPAQFLERAFLKVHRALGEYASRFSMLETPRTTAVGCIIQDDHATFAHVGDSRGYLMRGGHVLSRTKDHSKVAYLLEQGLITEAEAAKHPERNKIYSCLGGLVEPVIDLSKRVPIQPGDILLLCTDGLWSAFQQREMASWLAKSPIIHSLPSLLREAEVRGGNEGDNATAIAVRWGPHTLPMKEDSVTHTEGLTLGEFSTQLEKKMRLENMRGATRDLTEEEIEQAISEIQDTIKKYSR